MRTIIPNALKGTMDEIGSLKSLEQVYRNKAKETKKQSISSHIKEIDGQMIELKSKEDTIEENETAYS